jgi:hypothetical protein
MPKKKTDLTIIEDTIVSKIRFIRGEKVMLDRDLAELYRVETRTLNQAVKRNKNRFPNDFMFQLNKQEFENLTSQIVMSNAGGIRRPPYAFTEQGVAMLSSILNSEIAIAVNIQIIRVFTKMRELILAHKDIMLQIKKLEKEVGNNTDDIKIIFNYLNELLNPENARVKIGYKVADTKENTNKAKSKKARQ